MKSICHGGVLNDVRSEDGQEHKCVANAVMVYQARIIFLIILPLTNDVKLVCKQSVGQQIKCMQALAVQI